MPAPAHIRAAQKKHEANIGSQGMTAEEREAKRKNQEVSKSEKSYSPWLIGLLFIVVFGSFFVQIINNILYGPSMSVEH